MPALGRQKAGLSSRSVWSTEQSSKTARATQRNPVSWEGKKDIEKQKKISYKIYMEYKDTRQSFKAKLEDLPDSQNLPQKIVIKTV